MSVCEELSRASRIVRKLVSVHGRDWSPYYLVCEYPKSGGTWLAAMLADYLGLPFVDGYGTSLTPVARSVIRVHWKYDTRLRRCIAMCRDGRDVMVSQYFFHMRAIQTGRPTRWTRRLAARYEQGLGRGYDPADARQNLPRFIEIALSGAKPVVVETPWQDHVRSWQSADPEHVLHVSYEELLADPAPALTRCLRHFACDSLDRERVRQITERHSFSNKAGRPAGVEDRKSFYRKGIVGDWKNYFGREAAQVFDHLAGDTLVALGYEADHGWVQTVDS